MSPKSWPLPSAPSESLNLGPRRLLAALLRLASASLASLAQGLEAGQRPQRWVAEEADFEFHADAGAPEGALYVDGRFIGWIDGVKRL